MQSSRVGYVFVSCGIRLTANEYKLTSSDNACLHCGSVIEWMNIIMDLLCFN